MWLYRWIVKRTPFTRLVLARGGEQGQNVYLRQRRVPMADCFEKGELLARALETAVW